MIAEGVLDAAGRPVDAAYGLHVQSSVIAARSVRLPAGAADGRVRRAVRAGDRGRRPRLAPARRARPGAGRLRDGHRAADHADPAVRRRSSRWCSRSGCSRPGPGATSSRTRRRSRRPSVRSIRRSASRSRSTRSSCARGSRPRTGCASRRTTSGEYPVTVNNAAEYEFVAATAREVFGEERFAEMPNPITGSEDFSRVLDRVPGVVRVPRRLRRPTTRSTRRRTTRRAPRSTTASSATARRCSPSWPCGGWPVRRRSQRRSAPFAAALVPDPGASVAAA